MLAFLNDNVSGHVYVCYGYRFWNCSDGAVFIYFDCIYIPMSELGTVDIPVVTETDIEGETTL